MRGFCICGDLLFSRDAESKGFVGGGAGRYRGMLSRWTFAAGAGCCPKRFHVHLDFFTFTNRVEHSIKAQLDSWLVVEGFPRFSLTCLGAPQK